MVVEILEPNACFRGCCCSQTIPLNLRPCFYSLSSPIARGAESVVYEAILDGETVAVKKPVISTSDDLDKFHKELNMLCKLNHPGILKLVAAHAKPPNYMFFFELYKGNLAHKLHVEECVLSVPQVIKIAAQLAKALQYLHCLGIIHRDVKPANILLNDSFHSCLADFGLAAYKNDVQQLSVQTWKSSGKPTGGFHKKNMVGTLIYMAPEVLRKEIHTEKSDVYSFGVTINELITGVVPYTDLRAETQAHTVLEMNYTEQKLVGSVASEGLRPALAGLDSGAPAGLISLIQRCWDPNPENRPCFDDIVLELNTMLENFDNIDDHPTYSAEPVSYLVASDIPSYQEPINWFKRGQDFVKGHCLNFKNTASTFLSSSYFDSDYSPVLSWGSFSTCGRRETMEDTHFMISDFHDNVEFHLFGIFDGHRGSAAAEFSAGALPGFLRSLTSMRFPYQALKEAFIQMDIAFRSELASLRKFKGLIKKDWHPGCTAVSALVVKNKLFVANAGDCRTVLCRAENPIALSRDHVASSLEERERVRSAGGEVKWQVDTWRIGPAALQVTRSIGDDDLKPFVTAEPEITETELTEEDEYMVMASDGLWDRLSDRDVINIVKDTVKEPGMCSKRLVTEAIGRGSDDNVTVIVVFLHPVSTAERIY
ncbi:hypothetical protein M569_06125 [Genlisea aurea]|uniref:Protein-serine/threonine phosphatase n=1 Tax=Genlisea aurea TaxID=192259 RepID=S8DZ71_9LAMI|nr:hypothetical protein M569_06125 [Genlisea aurea]